MCTVLGVLPTAGATKEKKLLKITLDSTNVRSAILSFNLDGFFFVREYDGVRSVVFHVCVVFVTISVELDRQL